MNNNPSVLNVMERFSIDLLNRNSEGINFSFINLASIKSVIENYDRSKSLYFFCDGWMASSLLSLLTLRRFERVSFDFSSIAHEVFTFSEMNDRRLFFVGSREVQLNQFLQKIQIRYPNLIIAGKQHGYFSQEQQSTVCHSIIDSKADIVIVSMGAGRQEELLSELKSLSFQGIGFTCGGFFRQESSKQGNYYPEWINRFGLRAFYRMYKEPHTIKRYLLDYPQNLVKVSYFVLSGKIKISQ